MELASFFNKPLKMRLLNTLSTIKIILMKKENGS